MHGLRMLDWHSERFSCSRLVSDFKRTLLHHRAATLTEDAKSRMEGSKIQSEAGQQRDLALPKNRCCELCAFLSRHKLSTVFTKE